MVSKRAKETFLTRFLNVKSNELSRVCACFFVKFFYRFGFVVGWTVIIALLVSNYGIKYLPFLFMANGLFILASGTVYTRLVSRFKNSHLIIWTVLTASVVILLATLLMKNSNVFIFPVLIFAESFFLYQLNILIAAFVERFFTPLSSQRTFPVIESADTVAILLAGIVLATLSEIVEPHNFLYLWIFSILMIVPALSLANRYLGGGYSEEISEAQKKKSTFIDILVKGIGRSRKTPFLATLVFIVLFQWLFFSLMEFQYTKSISASVMSDMDLPQTVSSYEHALVHALGSLQILFGGSALFIQVFAGSRIIASLGVVSSILLYPMVAFLSVLGLTLNFSYLTGVFAKNNTEMTNAIFKNAYHSAFYILPDKSRELSREFLDGFVRPFSAIIGMSIIVVLQFLFKGEMLLLTTNAALAITAVFMMGYVLRSRKQYTRSAVALLFDENSSVHDKEDAVEILMQKGHSGVFAIFSKALSSDLLPEKVKTKIIDILANLDYNSSCEYLAHLLLCDDKVVSKKVFPLIENKIPKNILRHIKTSLNKK
ncbi:MAG: hypothetical protein ABH856_00870 [Patescibacteria group bacterium]|nr:hypothetical protein [Patescibacteria group bacterium]